MVGYRNTSILGSWGLSNRGLSALVRNFLVKDEGRGIANVTTGKVSGMTSIYNRSILLWAYE